MKNIGLSESEKMLRQKGGEPDEDQRKGSCFLGFRAHRATLSLGTSGTGMLLVASRSLYSCMSAAREDTASVKVLSSIPSTCR